MSSAAHRVTVVIVTYNSGHCIAPLAPGLRGLPHLVVVDNGSSDNTAAQVAQHLPQALWLPLPANLGFGAANNRGVAATATPSGLGRQDSHSGQAGTDFVLLLNPDCTVEPGALDALVATADRHPDAAAVAPLLLDRQGRPDISYRWRTDRWASHGPGADATCCVGFASGACLLVRRAAMARIGGFDESFFLYYEDDDLCIRLQQQCGALLLEPAAVVRHVSRGSVGGKARLKAEYLRGYHHIQSKFRFQGKHLQRAVTTPRRLRYALVAALETGLRLLLGDTRRAWRCAGRVAGAWQWRAA